MISGTASHARWPPTRIAPISTRGRNRGGTGQGRQRQDSSDRRRSDASRGKSAMSSSSSAYVFAAMQRIEPGLELVGLQTSFEVALPQDLTDCVALLVADTQRAVAWAVTSVVPGVSR